jgi:hypothetical protein
MEDVLIALLAIGIGAAFCFRGYLSMRLVFPLWGALVGFGFGATLVTSFTSDRFLGSLLGWVVGLAFAVLFAILAYAFFAVSVLIGMATIGYVLGVALMVALEVEWQWLTVLVGIALGAVLALLAIVIDFPMLLLTVLTAAAGATAMTAGVMLLTGVFSHDDLSRAGVTEKVNASVWWWLLDAGLAVAGLIVQLRAERRLRLTLRGAWEQPHAGRAGQPA